MVKNPRVSVIVPVFKAEKYLHRCLDSIIAQTLKDWELLLVDDGSPDNSGKLCDEYAQKDSRIKVFHKENGGVSSARQMGLDNATGEYTIHADPDDWVEPTMLEELYAKAIEDKADMVICDYYEVYTYKQNYIQQKPLFLDGETILQQLLEGSLHGSLCNKLIKRNCYNKYKVHFPSVITWEDLFVVCDLLLNDIRITYLNKAFYHYDMFSNTSSITRFRKIKNIESQVFFIEYFEAKLKEDKYKKGLFSRKLATKELSWFVPEFSYKQFVSLFPETNDFYLSKKKNIRSLSFYIRLSLLGFDQFSKFLYKIICVIMIPFIKRMFKI